MDAFKYVMAKWAYGYHQPIKAIEKLDLNENSTLLLVGCGFGKTAIMAGERFRCKVTGAEIAPFLVDRANRRVSLKGLADKFRFISLDPEEPYFELKANAIFFDSILSFLNKPSEVLQYYSQMIEPNGRIGVVELILRDETPEYPLINSLREIFGNEAQFKHDKVWRSLFKTAGLELVDAGTTRLGFMRKFWDDLREEPFGTLIDLSKTIYMSYTDEKAKRSMQLFRKFFKKYSKSMACASYSLKRSY